MFRTTAAALLLSAIALAPLPASAAAYDFVAAPFANDSQLSLGFVFSTNEAVTVSALGYFDDGGDGFATAHTVGIFDGSGTMLTSATLSVGGADPLAGQFRYASIAPVTLASGATYTLAATTGGSADAWVYGEAGTTISGFTADPAITIGANAARFDYQGDDLLRDPASHFSNYTVYGGPNFQIGNPIPEPATASTFGLSLLLTLALRRRNKR